MHAAAQSVTVTFVRSPYQSLETHHGIGSQRIRHASLQRQRSPSFRLGQPPLGMVAVWWELTLPHVLFRCRRLLALPQNPRHLAAVRSLVAHRLRAGPPRLLPRRRAQGKPPPCLTSSR